MRSFRLNCSMKWYVALLFSLASLHTGAQTPRIHAHNDYQKPEPLFNALRNQAYTIEADVYLVGDSLRVAHDKKDLATAPSLHTLYLRPITNLFEKNDGRISEDSAYSPVLMIDIKENGEAVLSKLVSDLSASPTIFDRHLNTHAVQVVISGDRGPVSHWKDYPAYIQFDGRPNETYDSVTLKRVAFISDTYLNYIKNPDGLIPDLARRILTEGKLLRLWAIPDNPEGWEKLLSRGVDILNTDHVEECRKHFLEQSN